MNLHKSYSADKESLITQKVINAFCIYILILLHFTSILNIGWFLGGCCLGNTERIFSFIYVQSGFFPPWITLTTFFLYNSLGVIVLFLTLRLSRRQEEARNRLVYILPYVCLTFTLDVFLKFTDSQAHLGASTRTSILFSVVLIAIYGIYGSMVYFYTRPKTINEFFHN